MTELFLWQGARKVDGTVSCIYNRREGNNLKIERTITSKSEKIYHLFSEDKKQWSKLKGPGLQDFSGILLLIYIKIKLQFRYFLVLCWMTWGLLITSDT